MVKFRSCALVCFVLFANIILGKSIQKEVGEPPVKEPAHFPGGDSACMKWIRENIKYPEACLKEGVEGRVVVGFTVDTDGSFKDAIAHISTDARLEAEVWRLVVAMPAWIPAKWKGMNTPSHVCIPVTFRLPGNAVQPEDTIFNVDFVEAKFQNTSKIRCSNWINAHLKDSKVCRLRGLSGEVKVSVVVGNDGNVVETKVIKSPDANLTQEVLRLLNEMPRFKPATVDGVPARDRFELSVNYTNNIPKKIVDFTAVDLSNIDFEVQEASFPGDNTGYISWLKQNYDAPECCLDNDDDGVAVVKVVIEKNGLLSNAKVEFSSEPCFVEDTWQYLEKMPVWEPAKINGTPIDSYVYLILPFTKSVNTLIPPDFYYRMSSFTQPEFPGGQEAFHKWVKKNLNYPEKCRKEGITGTVIVKFFVDKDGSVSGSKIVSGRAYDSRYREASYDAFAGEALRLVTFMPKWSPAKIGSMPVKKEVSWPINFGIKVIDEDTGHYELLQK